MTLTGHPFDTLKVRLQTQPMDRPIYNGSEFPPARPLCVEARR